MEVGDSGLKDARDQLTMIFNFFPRVEAKLSTVLAIDTAMLAALSASVPDIRQLSMWMAGPPIAATVFLAISYAYLYRGGFPNLKGGNHSLVYFKEIASRTESRYIEAYREQTNDSLRDDLLGQVWRNSEILADKYRYLEQAFIWMVLGMIPWSISLTVFAMHRAKIQIMVSH